MRAFLPDKVFRPSSGAFVRAARALGVSQRVAKSLEAAAQELVPDAPEEILRSRALFEQAATRAVVGDGGNLELSFSLVDALANTVETLGLARSSDVPDPFRRVWVSNASRKRVRGVVLTCQKGEVAVFCPPAEQPISEIGTILWLHYRGFTSPVEYELQLDDAVRLPGAMVLHLARRNRQGEIGRASVRYPTCIQALVRALEPEAGAAACAPCEVLDVSSGGLALKCAIPFEKGQRVRVDLPLPDGTAQPLRAKAVVCWRSERAQDEMRYGLAFSELPRPHAERLERFLRTLAAEQESATSSRPTPPASEPITREEPSSSEAHESPVPLPALQARARRPPRTRPVQSSPIRALAVPSRAAPRSEAAWFESTAPEPEALADSGLSSRVVTGGEQELLRSVLAQICESTTTLLEHHLSCEEVRAQWVRSRVAGSGTVHISFKFAIDVGDEWHHGCLLIPLADAVAMASSFLMLPSEVILENRTLEAPDEKLKEALLELCSVLGTALDAGLRSASHEGAPVRALGCQGVRPDIRPALPYREGTDLLVGRATARFMEADPFELILMLPAVLPSAAG